MEQENEFLESVKRGDRSAVEDWLRLRRELVRFADDHGKTGLHWAAECDQPEVADILLNAGADIEARTAWGATPLDWAATMGNVRVADLLLARGASRLTLVVAAALGKLAEVRVTIASGADLAAHRRRGAPQSPNDEWPADSAYMQGDVISDAMYAAARNGHAQVVDYLLDQGALIDPKGVFGATALHWAAMNGHTDTANILLDRGASLTIRDAQFNGTPEDWAREGGHIEIANALRARGETA